METQCSCFFKMWNGKEKCFLIRWVLWQFAPISWIIMNVANEQQLILRTIFLNEHKWRQMVTIEISSWLTDLMTVYSDVTSHWRSLKNSCSFIELWFREVVLIQLQRVLFQVGGQVSRDLKKLLLVLMMTLPGSPAVRYDEDLDQTQVKSCLRHYSSLTVCLKCHVAKWNLSSTQNVSMKVSSSQGEAMEPDTSTVSNGCPTNNMNEYYLNVNLQKKEYMSLVCLTLVCLSHHPSLRMGRRQSV